MSDTDTTLRRVSTFSQNPLNRRRGWRRLDAMLDVLRAVLGLGPEDFRATVRAAWANTTSVHEAAELLRGFRAGWLSDCPLFVAQAPRVARRAARQQRHPALARNTGRYFRLPHFMAADLPSHRCELERYQSEAETVVDLGEWRWVRSAADTSSRIEGLLMHHCGNSARENLTLYSLRHRLRRYRGWCEFWMPHLTVLLSGREIIEIRGRANTHAHPKYHLMLLELLVRTDLVAGFGYEGCKIRSFSGAELSVDLQKQLLVRRAGDIGRFYYMGDSSEPHCNPKPDLPDSLRPLLPVVAR